MDKMFTGRSYPKETFKAFLNFLMELNNIKVTDEEKVINESFEKNYQKDIENIDHELKNNTHLSEIEKESLIEKQSTFKFILKLYKDNGKNLSKLGIYLKQYVLKIYHNHENLEEFLKKNVKENEFPLNHNYFPNEEENQSNIKVRNDYDYLIKLYFTIAFPSRGITEPMLHNTSFPLANIIINTMIEQIDIGYWELLKEFSVFPKVYKNIEEPLIPIFKRELNAETFDFIANSIKGLKKFETPTDDFKNYLHENDIKSSEYIFLNEYYSKIPNGMNDKTYKIVKYLFEKFYKLISLFFKKVFAIDATPKNFKKQFFGYNYSKFFENISLCQKEDICEYLENVKKTIIFEIQEIFKYIKALGKNNNDKELKKNIESKYPDLIKNLTLHFQLTEFAPNLISFEILKLNNSDANLNDKYDTWEAFLNDLTLTINIKYFNTLIFPPKYTKVDEQHVEKMKQILTKYGLKDNLSEEDLNELKNNIQSILDQAKILEQKKIAMIKLSEETKIHNLLIERYERVFNLGREYIDYKDILKLIKENKLEKEIYISKRKQLVTNTTRAPIEEIISRFKTFQSDYENTLTDLFKANKFLNEDERTLTLRKLRLMEYPPVLFDEAKMEENKKHIRNRNWRYSF